MIIQWSDEDQVFICSLQEWGDGCKTHGKTYESAAKAGREVLEMLIESTLEDGKKLPTPSKFHDEWISLKQIKIWLYLKSKICMPEWPPLVARTSSRG